MRVSMRVMAAGVMSEKHLTPSQVPERRATGSRLVGKEA